jgi:hypothetical protein
MIALVALALVQATPSVQPTFGFYCKIEGLMAQDGPTDFPQKRPLALLIRRTGFDSFSPVQTYDPSGLLGGRQFKIFNTLKGATVRYGAATGSRRTAPADILATFLPSDSKQFNGWQISLAPMDHGPSPTFTVGHCLLTDGMTEDEFRQVTSGGTPK